MKRVQVFGNGPAEVKIYPLRRKGTRYRSFQVSWYELGERRTKTLADPLEAKSCAQQVHVSLLNKGRAVDVTPQDIQMLRDAEFKSDTDNGWASMSVTPACEETADWLLNLTRQVIDATSIQFIEGFSSWRN